MNQQHNLDMKIGSLTEEIGNLHEELRAALATLRKADNPKGAIIQTSSIALQLIRDGLLEQADPDNKPHNDNLFACCQHAVKKGLLPAEIDSYLQNPRFLSNKADHAVLSINPTTHDAEILLSQLLRFCEWFFCESQHGPKLSTIYTALPMPPESERETIVGLRFADVSNVFKDREENIVHLRRLLGDQQAKLICIVGRGGIGKTALLSKVCAEIESGELRLSDTATAMGADGIIYISCRGTDKPTVERLFHNVGQMLGSPHSEALMDYWRNSSRSLADKVRFLLSKLRDGYYLLVLDNLEDILAPDNTIADDDLREFVDVCLTMPHALRLIATSRERVEVSEQVLQARRFVFLDQLEETDAIALLRDLDTDGELGLRKADDELLKEAARLCFGVPLALQRLAGILSRGEAPTLEKLLEDTTLFNEQVVKNLIDYQYRRVSDDQRRVLEALAVYNKPVPADAVRYLLESFFPNIDVDACLHDLVRSYFVTHPEKRDTYELHSLDQQHAYVHIPDKDSDDTKRALHQRIVAFVMNLVEALRAGQPIYTKRTLHHRAAEFYMSHAEEVRAGQPIAKRLAWDIDVQRQWVEAVGKAVEHLFKAEAWGDLVQAHETIKEFYLARFNGGYVQECADIYQRMLHAAQAANEESVEADWLHNLAVMKYEFGDYTAAEQSCLRGLEIARSTGQEGLQAACLHRLGMVMQDQGNYEQARELYEQSLRIREKVGDEVEVASTQGQSAELLENEGNLEQALEVQRKFLKLAKKARNYNWILTYSRRLARILRKQGNYIEAEKKCLEDIELAQQFYGRVHARDLLEAGYVALDRKEYNKAQEFFLGGKKVAVRPRNKSQVLLALGMLNHHTGNLPDARRYYEDTLAFDFPATKYSCAVRLGILCLEEGNKEETQANLERGIALCHELLEKTPRLYDALYHLALAQLGIGQPDDALATYRQALEVCSAKGVVQSALQDLCLLQRAAQPVVGVTEAVALLEETLETS